MAEHWQLKPGILHGFVPIPPFLSPRHTSSNFVLHCWLVRCHGVHYLHLPEKWVWVSVKSSPGTRRVMSSDQMSHEFQSDESQVLIRRVMSSDQTSRKFWSDKSWVPIRRVTSSDQMSHEFRSDESKVLITVFTPHYKPGNVGSTVMKVHVHKPINFEISIWVQTYEDNRETKV